MRTPDPDRIDRHRRASRALARLDDDSVRDLVAGGRRLGSGIGGTTVRLDVDGVPVFVKRIPLTDLEREPGNAGSTANLFGLPMYFHYGIGSPGFGAWREIAAHDLTTGWVLSGEADCFPLTYHWRVLPAEAAELPPELRDVDAAVRYWDDSPAVRTRIRELAYASAQVVVFCEYLPYTLADWLSRQPAAGPAELGTACGLVERELHRAADLMAAQRFLHLDAHFENVLTDGERVYLADLGLAVATEFDLAGDEREFLDRHRGYDRSYLAAQLDGWIRSAVEEPTTVPEATRILDRYEPVVATVRPFYRSLQTESRTTPYPVAAEREAWERVTLPRPAADPAPRE